jgi:hypothetical protein
MRRTPNPSHFTSIKVGSLKALTLTPKLNLDPVRRASVS